MPFINLKYLWDNFRTTLNELGDNAATTYLLSIYIGITIKAPGKAKKLQKKVSQQKNPYLRGSEEDS